MFFGRGGAPGGMPSFHEGFPHPFGMHGEGAQDTELYDTLEVAPDASGPEIKKAYKKLALKNHPDRGGDEDRFKKISAAYEVLSDPDRREAYDRCGKAGLEGAGMDNFDLFSQLFGGGQRAPPRAPRERRGKDVHHALRVTLEDLYCGKVRKMAVERKVPKDPGRPAERCQTCRGTGVVTLERRLGPMLTQTQHPCQRCGGLGVAAELTVERKVLEVTIEKGMQDGDTIKFHGEADQLPGTIPGDILFRLQLMRHPSFVRRGDHLLVTKEISLREALVGCSLHVVHLDKRVLELTSREVIRPTSIKVVRGEGMPRHGDPFTKGDLVLRFDIQYPSALSASTVKALERVLPAPPPAAAHLSGTDTYSLGPDVDPASLRHTAAPAAGGGEAHDDEDRGFEPGGAPPVQCAQQ